MRDVRDVSAIHGVPSASTTRHVGSLTWARPAALTSDHLDNIRLCTGTLETSKLHVSRSMLLGADRVKKSRKLAYAVGYLLLFYNISSSVWPFVDLLHDLAVVVLSRQKWWVRFPHAFLGDFCGCGFLT